MIKDIFKTVIQNFQQFIVIWVVVILANQLIIFGACFAPYCLLAALPHTFVVAALIAFFLNSSEASNSLTVHQENNKKISKSLNHQNLDELIKFNKAPFQDEDLKKTSCPKCGAPMNKKTARQGRYAGNDFWGCSKYPQCKGIRNIE